jgi:hypothetical protein
MSAYPSAMRLALPPAADAAIDILLTDRTGGTPISRSATSSTKASLTPVWAVIGGVWVGTNYSHSIVFDHGNALNSQRKFFLYAMKNRLPDPSEICALDFKREFRRSAVCSVSETIYIDRSIFLTF